MSNKAKNLLWITICVVLYSLYFFGISRKLLVDSDEITWSIIGRRVFSGADFHKFFLGQKYIGAIEGYIVGLFQIIFGYNTFSLRINSFIFGGSLGLLIFFAIKKHKGIWWAFFAFLTFTFFKSPEIALHFVKAYGNRPFISLIGLASLIISYQTYLAKKQNHIFWLSLLNGLLLGLAFWGSLEALAFLVFNFFVFFLSLILKRKFLIEKKITLASIVSLALYLSLGLLLFMLFTKRALINPYLTISSKIGFNLDFLKIFDFTIEPKNVLYVFYAVSILKIAFFPSKNKLFGCFNLTMLGFFIGCYFNITFLSIGRTAGEVISLKESYNFVQNILFPKFIGYTQSNLGLLKTFLVFSSVFVFPVYFSVTAIKKVISSIKLGKVNFSYFDLLWFYLLIPIFFILSKPSGAGESARYLTSMWPGFILCWILGLNLIFKKGLFFKLFCIFLAGYYFFNFSNFPKFIKEIKNPKPENSPLLVANYLMGNGIKTCYAGYWNAYPIMFESRYKVICSPSDQYRYGTNETPFYTEIVDKDNNLAFIFTTEKRVEQFKNTWADKEFTVKKFTEIKPYFVLITERIKQ